MCDYLPEGCRDSDFDVNDELALNQQTEYDFYENAVKKLNEYLMWLDNNCPKESKDYKTIVEDIYFCDYDIEDYLSEPEIEDREYD